MAKHTHSIQAQTHFHTAALQEFGKQSLCEQMQVPHTTDSVTIISALTASICQTVILLCVNVFVWTNSHIHRWHWSYQTVAAKCNQRKQCHTHSYLGWTQRKLIHTRRKFLVWMLSPTFAPKFLCVHLVGKSTWALSSFDFSATIFLRKCKISETSQKFPKIVMRFRHVPGRQMCWRLRLSLLAILNWALTFCRAF